MITKESLEKGYEAAKQGRPFEEVRAAYTGLPIRVVKANETPTKRMYRAAVALVREFAKEHPKETLEIVQQEILDKR